MNTEGHRGAGSSPGENQNVQNELMELKLTPKTLNIILNLNLSKDDIITNYYICILSCSDGMTIYLSVQLDTVFPASWFGHLMKLLLS